MKTSLPKPPLLVIVGPTAVGKTELSLRIAEELHGEIVSADSRLFYHGMDIGTAKPTAAEQARVPHHLIDLADPDDVWSLTRYQAAAQQVIADIQARGRLPMLVGGTGQYIRAVIEGWQAPEQVPDEKLRGVLEAWAQELGAQALHDRLRVLDPAAAERIDAPNVRRTIRALEVIFGTGERFSDQIRKSLDAPYHVLQIGLRRPRPELYERVDRRIDAMLADGLLDEVRDLLARGYDPNLPTLSAIGYREIIAHLQGSLSLEEAVMLIRRKTRRFVRHQGAWFAADDPAIHWFDMTPDPLDAVLALATGWLEALA